MSESTDENNRSVLAPAGTIAILILAAGVFAYIAWEVRAFTVDDAFITFRYAQNLAAGYGPTYNPGGPRVEGYTTFLWMLLMAIPHLVHVDVVVFAKLLGVACALGLFAVVYAWTVRLASPSRYAGMWAAVAVLLLAALPGMGIHAISGMETMLFALLLTMLFHLSSRWCEAPSRGVAIRFAICALLLGLTRPEGNLAALVAFCVMMTIRPWVAVAIPTPDPPVNRRAISRQKAPSGQVDGGVDLQTSRPRREFAALVALVYIAPALVYFLWRWHYYGHPFPLSFYLKVSNQHGLAGLPDVEDFLSGPIVPLAIAAAIGVAVTGRRVLPALAAAIVLLAFFLFPAHIMAFEYRYLFPVYPLACVLAATGLAWVGRRLTGDGTVSRRAAVLGIAIAAIVLGVSMASDIPDSISGRVAYGDGMRDAHIRLGREMARVSGGPNGPLVALVDAGAIPYFSRWRALDTYGLNNPRVALTDRHSVDDILAAKPDVLVLVSNDKDNFSANDWNVWEPELYRRCRALGMKRVREYTFAQDDYYLWVMADPNGPVCRKLGWKPD